MKIDRFAVATSADKPGEHYSRTLYRDIITCYSRLRRQSLNFSCTFYRIRQREGDKEPNNEGFTEIFIGILILVIFQNLSGSSTATG